MRLRESLLSFHVLPSSRELHVLLLKLASLLRKKRLVSLKRRPPPNLLLIRRLHASLLRWRLHLSELKTLVLLPMKKMHVSPLKRPHSEQLSRQKMPGLPQ